LKDIEKTILLKKLFCLPYIGQAAKIMGLTLKDIKSCSGLRIPFPH
jgi:hypothetical protein